MADKALKAQPSSISSFSLKKMIKEIWKLDRLLKKKEETIGPAISFSFSKENEFNGRKEKKKCKIKMKF